MTETADSSYQSRQLVYCDRSTDEAGNRTVQQLGRAPDPAARRGRQRGRRHDDPVCAPGIGFVRDNHSNCSDADIDAMADWLVDRL